MPPRFDQLPDDVRALVHGPVASMAHVDALLALRAASPEARSATELADDLRADPAALRRTLEELAAAGLLERDGDRHRYHPATPTLRDAVDALARAYDERPLTLVRTIYERPVRAVQSFADAFRVRRPNE